MRPKLAHPTILSKTNQFELLIIFACRNNFFLQRKIQNSLVWAISLQILRCSNLGSMFQVRYFYGMCVMCNLKIRQTNPIFSDWARRRIGTKELAFILRTNSQRSQAGGVARPQTFYFARIQLRLHFFRYFWTYLWSIIKDRTFASSFIIKIRVFITYQNFT